MAKWILIIVLAFVPAGMVQAGWSVGVSVGSPVYYGPTRLGGYGHCYRPSYGYSRAYYGYARPSYYVRRAPVYYRPAPVYYAPPRYVVRPRVVVPQKCYRGVVVGY